MDVRRGWGYPVFNVVRGQGRASGGSTFPTVRRPTRTRTATSRTGSVPFSGNHDAVGHLHRGRLETTWRTALAERVLHDSLVPVERPPTRAVRARRRCCVRPTAGSVQGLGAHLPQPGPLLLRPGRPGLVGRLVDSVAAGLARPCARATRCITSTYDNSHSSWYENMGIVLLYIAKGDDADEPFAQASTTGRACSRAATCRRSRSRREPGRLPDPRSVARTPSPRRWT